MNSKTNRIIFWSVLAVVAASLAVVVKQGQPRPKATYSEFLQRVGAGDVKKATIVVGSGSGADQIDYTLGNGRQARTVIPSDDREALAAMRDKLVNVEIRSATSQPVRLLVNASPFFLLLGFWVFMMRRKMQPRL